MSKKEKATREYLETLSKEQVIDLCLQYINDKNIAEQQLEALMLEISKQEVEQHDLPDYCTRTGTDCTNLGKIEELQRQLAEKDTRITELEDKDWYEACINQLEEQNNRLIDKLKEKDKEIERLKERLSVFDNFKDNYGYTNYDDSEILEDLQSRAFQAEDDTQVVNELLQFFNIFDENELVDKVKETPTQLAINELEKVKKFAENLLEKFCSSWEYHQKYMRGHRHIEYYDLIQGIDNRIKELKREK